MRTRDGGNGQKNTGIGCVVLMIFVGLFYLIGIDGENRNQPAAPPTVTKVVPSTPAPTQAAFFIPTPAPGLVPASRTQSRSSAAEIARLAQQYPEADLKATLSAVEGVSSVTTALVRPGPSVYAEITVEASQNSIRVADQLRLALGPLLKEAVAEYVFILDDGQQASEYTYRDGIWTATPL
jgi:hypothetical protein